MTAAALRNTCCSDRLTNTVGEMGGLKNTSGIAGVRWRTKGDSLDFKSDDATLSQE